MHQIKLGLCLTHVVLAGFSCHYMSSPHVVSFGEGPVLAVSHILDRVFLGVRLCEFDDYSVTDDTSSLFLTTVSFALLTVLLIEIC